MRVLHILDHSVPLQSGYAFRTLAILREQRALGWETAHVTSPKHYGTDTLEERVAGLHFYRTPRGNLAGVPVLNQWGVIRALRRRIEELIPVVQPDLLHAHSPALNGVAALAVSRRHGIPLVYEVRAFWEDAATDHGTSAPWGLRYRLTRALESHVLKRADEVTVICEGLREEIGTRGISRERVTVIPNAVDLDRFKEVGRRDEKLARALGLQGKKVVGFMGSFYAYEGLALLLQSFRSILAARPEARLLLVGGGPQEHELRAMARALGLQEEVVFVGRVPHEEIDRYYSLVDVSVYPRLPMRLTNLVTPLKPLESMAMKRPVVASDVGGHRELIRDGDTGRLFKAGDIESLSSVLIEVLSHTEQWPAMKEAGLAFVREERNWRVSVARYRDVYQRALRRTHPQPRPAAGPRLVVLSSVFPHSGAPNSGLFIRERMFRVARELPLVVVAPVPWFPLQSLIRRYRPHFRPDTARHETQEGVDVYHPRFFSFPGMLKFLDSFFMALGGLRTLHRIRARIGFDVLDAHFAFPEGHAAILLGRWFKVPVTVTLRGTVVRHTRSPILRTIIRRTLQRSSLIVCVSTSLKEHALALGAEASKIRVIPNGVDTACFYPVDREEARASLGLSETAPVLVSVGGLVERKGFHRVLDCIPQLLRKFPDLKYLIVGGGGAEGDWERRLRRQASEHGIEESVRFLGALPPDGLRVPLSAANVFVLATRNEGWANVFLEAMACGVPVVTTDVGGNREVVSRREVGIVVPFGDHDALQDAIEESLTARWNHDFILDYARRHTWDDRVQSLGEALRGVVSPNARGNPLPESTTVPS